MRFIKSKRFLKWIGAAAMTVYPFIIIDPRYLDNTILIEHEMVHIEQQKRWFKYGLGIGLLLWFFLYLLVLPVYWNPFRRKWETEAYKKAQKFSNEQIDEILSKAPYYLKK